MPPAGFTPPKPGTDRHWPTGDPWGVTLDLADLPPFLAKGYRPGFDGANSTPGTMLQSYQLIDYRGLKTRSGKDVVDTYLTRYCEREFDAILVGRDDYHPIREQVAFIRYLQSWGLTVHVWATGSGDEGGGRAGWSRAKDLILPLLLALIAEGQDVCDRLVYIPMQEAERGASVDQIRDIYANVSPILKTHGIPNYIHHVPNRPGLPTGDQVDKLGMAKASADEWARLFELGLDGYHWQADPMQDTGAMGGRAYEARMYVHAGSPDLRICAYELHGERQLYQGGPQTYPELNLSAPEGNPIPVAQRSLPTDPPYFDEEIGARQSLELLFAPVQPGSGIRPWDGCMSGPRWPDGRSVYRGFHSIPIDTPL